MIKCQCGYCRHLLGLPDTMGGRKILCPMCEDPLTVPKSTPPGQLKPPRLSEALERFKLNDWDKAFARKLLERHSLAEGDLYKALAAFLKAAKREDVSLSAFLAREGALAREEAELVRELLKGTVVSAKVEFVECPNCFANVDGRSRACKFCGQMLGDAATVSLCPNCKFENEKGAGRCRKCGADMRTGLLGTEKRCPACDKPLRHDGDKCPWCGATLKTYKDKRKDNDARRRRKQTLMGLAAGGALALALLAGLAWEPVKHLLRVAAVGREQAELETSAHAFAAALREGRAPAEFLAPGLAVPEGAALRDCALGVGGEKRIKALKSLRITAIVLDQAKTAAEVTVEAEAVPEAPTGSDQADTRAVFGGGGISLTAIWKWKRENCEWRYAGPLP